MAIARWRIRRFVSAETVLIDCEIVRNRDKVEKEFDTLGCGVHVAMAIRRYEARHQRCHDKAYALSAICKHPEPHSPPRRPPRPIPNRHRPNRPPSNSPSHPPITQASARGPPAPKSRFRQTKPPLPHSFPLIFPFTLAAAPGKRSSRRIITSKNTIQPKSAPCSSPSTRGLNNRTAHASPIWLSCPVRYSNPGPGFHARL